jgi:hypothetical protein
MSSHARCSPLVLALILSACALPAADARFQERVPERSGFPAVAAVLEHSCGTLDCHGSSARNLRLYGGLGLRWSASDRPQTPACATPEEIDQDFASVVGLEPEVLSAVVADGGADPERLTLVRKARGLEHHKGGSPWKSGDDADTCLTAWLASAPDDSACARALPDPACLHAQ